MSFLSPGHLPDPGIEPGSPALQVDSLPPEPPIYLHRGWRETLSLPCRADGVKAKQQAELFAEGGLIASSLLIVPLSPGKCVLVGCRTALPFYYGLAGAGWEGLSIPKAGGLQGGSGLAWTRDIWARVVMQSAQPERGPHAAHRALGVHRVRGCDRPSVLERARVP